MTPRAGDTGPPRRLAARRGQPPGDLRPQARRPGRVSAARSADRHQRPRPPRQRTAAAARPASPTGSRSCGRSPTPAPATSGHAADLHGPPRSPSTGSSPTTPTCSPSSTGCGPTRRRPLPNYVGVSPIPYLGSAYLGPAYEPFAVHGDPNAPRLRRCPNIGLQDRRAGRPPGRPDAPARRASTGLPPGGRRRDAGGAFDAFRSQAVQRADRPARRGGRST